MRPCARPCVALCVSLPCVCPCLSLCPLRLPACAHWLGDCRLPSWSSGLTVTPVPCVCLCLFLVQWIHWVSSGSTQRLTSALARVCALCADANQPILIQWFWGAPETVTYIGTGEMVSWMWFDKGNYSIEGEGETRAFHLPLAEPQCPGSPSGESTLLSLGHWQGRPRLSNAPGSPVTSPGSPSVTASSHESHVGGGGW